MSVLVVTEKELRRAVRIDKASLAAVEYVFTLVSDGAVTMPPIMHVELSDRHGDVDIKSAYVHGLDSMAVKIASGFFDNPKLGLPSGSAMVVVLSTRTGFCEAVLLDNGYLTDLRTGLAGAVAARHLAPARVETVGVVGVGMQARYQIESLALVRDFGRLLVYGRDDGRSDAYMDYMRNALDIEVERVAEIGEVVGRSDVVVTTTPSTTALIEATHLHPGLHITAVGSDLAGKQEIAADALMAADIYVPDRLSQVTTMGELQHVRGGLDSLKRHAELGELTAGRVVGRSDDAAITICDLTGTGAQDTAIATLALKTLRNSDGGVDFS